MSDNIGQIAVDVRHAAGKGIARKLRATGKIPGVVYGKGEGNLLIALSPNEFRKALDPEKRLNTLLSVTVREEGKGDVHEKCVVADYQLHPVRDEFLHVDLLRVSEDQEVTTTIPVEYVGRAAGVVLGGKLLTNRRSVKISAKPGEIPTKLVVDVTELEAGQALRLESLTLAGARLLDSPQTVMASVDPPREAKEEKEEKP